MENRTIFPIVRMAYPEPSCNTPIFIRYRSLVQHWKTVHTETIEIYKCQVCRKSFTRRPDANRHLRNCHRADIETCNYPNRRYIKPTGEMPIGPPVIISVPSGLQPVPQPAVKQDSSRREAREAARLEMIRTREEALRGPLVAMVDRELNHVFPAETANFTLCQPEEELDNGDGQ